MNTATTTTTTTNANPMQHQHDESPAGQVQPGSTVFCYERVSSKGQNEPQYGRVGMNTQNLVMLEFALKRNLVIRGTAREVGSARNPGSLSQLQAVLRVIKPGECILVYAVSRFSRNLEQGRQMMQAIHAAGSWVYAITDHVSSFDPRFQLLLQEAQRESDLISQRVRDSIAARRAAGAHIGPAPFGSEIYRDQLGMRRLKRCEDEWETIAYLRGVHQATGDAAKTAATLNEAGRSDPRKLRRGKRWTKRHVVVCLGALQNNSFTRDMMGALNDIPETTTPRRSARLRESRELTESESTAM